MKAIKINSKEKTIELVEIDGSLESIYDQLECEIFTCPTTLDNLDTLYVDDEGLFNNSDKDYKGAFYFGDFQQPLFGHGLIIGADIEGESKDVLSSIKNIENIVQFINEDTGRYLLDKMQDNGFTFIPL